MQSFPRQQKNAIIHAIFANSNSRKISSQKKLFTPTPFNIFNGLKTAVSQRIFRIIVVPFFFFPILAKPDLMAKP